MDSQSVNIAMRWWGLTLVAVFIVVGIVLAMMPVAVGIVLLLVIAPRYILDRLIDRRRILLRDQMVRATVALANASRAGLSLAQGLESVAEETPAPLARELQRIVRDYHSGRPLADAIREVQERLRLEAFDVFAAAILVCLDRGGRVTYALERISDGLRELQRLERKLEADTAAGRRIAWILGLFPGVFLLGFSVMDPVAMAIMYTTLLGQFILLGIGVMVFAAVVWCRHLLNLDF
jgi:tight adherence protein B